MWSQKMDRGSRALSAHLNDSCSKIEIRQKKRGWLDCCQEPELQYFVDGNQIAHSKEETNFRQMVVKEEHTDNEIITVDRPFKCCCCHDSAVITSDRQKLGSVQEDCHYCFPSFTITDYDDRSLYEIRQPTCCCGCRESNSKMMQFHIFPASLQQNTVNGAKCIGKIIRIKRNSSSEVFDEVDVLFPRDAANYQKGIILGTAIFLHAISIDGSDEEEPDSLESDKDD